MIVFSERDKVRTSVGSAEDFFTEISKETGTCILWPTQLKVGAKSRRDPYIRIGGKQQGVQSARYLISRVLKSETNYRLLYIFLYKFYAHLHGTILKVAPPPCQVFQDLM